MICIIITARPLGDNQVLDGYLIPLRMKQLAKYIARFLPFFYLAKCSSFFFFHSFSGLFSSGTLLRRY
jgi:hypothetical protein